MTSKAYSAGIYCRLSNDDERDGESASIENQKYLLRRYVLEQGWSIYDTYVDDGYSGTNFQRPGVQRLLRDVKAGKINVVVVKDLSRFGRNYIEFGQYTDYLFPSLGCRFIALGNGIDTANQNGSTDLMCFLNVFNEFYSRDTSKKVKAVRRACAESGKFMGTYPAYGYQRDPADRHHLIIDAETAPVVRRIFALRAAGKGYREIAECLNREGVLSPGARYHQEKGERAPRQDKGHWAATTVKGILTNEVYIGNMVQGKTGTLSYKSRKLVSKPPEEWIRVEGTHEPILSRQVWDAVAAIGGSGIRRRRTREGGRSIFTGLVYCADCGSRLQNSVERFTRKDGTQARYSAFVCGNYRRSGRAACTAHIVYEKVLERIILDDVREKAQSARLDRDALLARILRIRDQERRSRAAAREREWKAAAARVKELESLMESLYQDKRDGTVSQTAFQLLMDRYASEHARKAALLPELEQKARRQRDGESDARRWTGMIQRYADLTCLDETLLLELVERIQVGEAEMINGVRVRAITIYYRYGSAD